MATIDCKECGKPTSEFAKKCPTCGAPPDKVVGSSWLKPTKPLGVILHLVGLVTLSVGATSFEQGDLGSALIFVLIAAGAIYWGSKAWTRRRWLQGMAVLAGVIVLMALMASQITTP